MRVRFDFPRVYTKPEEHIYVKIHSGVLFRDVLAIYGKSHGKKEPQDYRDVKTTILGIADSRVGQFCYGLNF